LIIHIEGMGDILSLFSTNSNFTTSRFGNGDENWTVNSALFESATLSRSASNSNRTFEISSELLAGTQSLRAEFLTSRELKYPNLESYWKVEHKEQVPEPADGLPFKYTLLSQKITAQDQDSDNLIIDPKEKKQNPDLQESANLQISIAPVQAMVAKLQSNGPLNRLQMARLIGKMVTETLTYDYDSVKESSIHALTTTEVLERKKGVCQHFANLFAVLARGVGIPARFITGYYLSPQGVGAHAWNEIEIRSGVWMPIEPQNSNLSLNPMFYFPLVTGGYMETMKDEDAFRDGKAMLIEFHAKALESIR
jgi:transglutaminase-like putative cysteine protease